MATLALASLALGILWSTEVATQREGYDEVVSRDAWGEHGAFTYEPVLADGSGTLTMGAPGYFTSEAPRVRVAFRWTLDDEKAERVTAIGQLLLRVHQEASGGHAAWTDTQILAEAPLDGTAQDALVMAGEADLVATQARIDETPGRDASDATWTFVAKVRFASAPDASHKDDASAFELPLSYTPPLYALPSADAASFAKDHAQTQVTHHAPPSAPRAFAAQPAGPMLLLAGLIGLGTTLPSLSREEEAA